MELVIFATEHNMFQVGDAHVTCGHITSVGVDRSEYFDRKVYPHFNSELVMSCEALSTNLNLESGMCRRSLLPVVFELPAISVYRIVSVS